MGKHLLLATFWPGGFTRCAWRLVLADELRLARIGLICQIFSFFFFLPRTRGREGREKRSLAPVGVRR